MCEFISWIDHPTRGTLYLDSKKLNSIKGEQLKLKTQENLDLVGHGAIREFYGIGSAGINQENQDFWNEELPNVIKKSWNSGKLDEMLNYLDSGDLEHILEDAPENYALFVLKKKRFDFKTIGNWKIGMVWGLKNKEYDWMLESEDEDVQMVGGLMSKKYEKMLKSENWEIRMMGGLMSKKYEKMLKDNDRDVRMVGAGLIDEKEVPMPECNWREEMVWGLKNEKYEEMLKSDNHNVQMMGGLMSKKYEEMLKDKDGDVRMVGAGMEIKNINDINEMLKSEDLGIQMMGRYLKFDSMDKRKIKRPRMSLDA